MKYIFVSLLSSCGITPIVNEMDYLLGEGDRLVLHYNQQLIKELVKIDLSCNKLIQDKIAMTVICSDKDLVINLQDLTPDVKAFIEKTVSINRSKFLLPKEKESK